MIWMHIDSVPFFANIALVAHADGKLTPSELGQLEAVRSDLKIKKSDFSKSMALVAAGGYSLTPVGSFSDQVRNLELMLRVAYAGDDLDDSESEIIAKFCILIGVTQEQIDRIEAEVIFSLKQTGMICLSCGASAEPNSKFCPGCGKALTTEVPPVLLEFEIPATGIAIEFADSTAASFSKALNLAKASTGYRTCQKNKKTWHLASFPSGTIAEALPIAEALSGIRNKTAYQNGTEKAWEDIFGFAWCASKRASSYRPAEYCYGKDENRLNPWGCKQARMNWTDWSDWFSYGAWEKAGMMSSKVVWRFDKERIRHELATRLHSYRYCPHLVANLYKAVLKNLPDTVDPSRDQNWTFNRSYNESPGCLKVVEKEGSGAYSFTNEYWSDGVRPKGQRLLGDLLKKSTAEVGGCGVSVAALLK